LRKEEITRKRGLSSSGRIAERKKNNRVDHLRVKQKLGEPLGRKGIFVVGK